MSVSRVSEILSSLDEVQKEAVCTGPGPVVVFAGAGSGKTRIITSKIAYLIEQGVHPSSILAVTFTNKAAKEMKERVLSLNERASKVFISTFHSACCRWCREFAYKLGFDSNFSIYDEQESKAALKTVIKQFTTNPEEYLEVLESFIEKMKTSGLSPVDVKERENHLHKQIPLLGVEIYKRYQEYLASCNAMDFGDLILNVLILLRKDKEVLDILSNRYKYILVDEYQDTNMSQIELITRLGSKHKNVFVVGDDDQSIYSWRGAKTSNILEFNQTFENAKVILMTRNYRSNSCIVEAANELIKNNKERAEKTLFSKIESKDKISFVRTQTDEEEASEVIINIKKEKQIYPYNKVAIFYRTNAQSRLIEDQLCYYNVPYQLYGALKFYSRVEIKDIIAYLKLILNEDDSISLKRVINTPLRGIGEVSIKFLEDSANEENISIMKYIRKSYTNKDESKLCLKDKKIISFLKIIDDIKDLFKDSSSLARSIEDMIVRLDYLSYLQKKYPDTYKDKIENVYELISSVSRYELKNPNTKDILESWLQNVSLSSEETEKTLDGVNIMTLHAAKGLEFDRVYIIGVEEGIIPHKSNLEGSLLEEERRLLYVGMTRAKKKLSFYCAKERFSYNHTSYNDVSRFLREIPSKYIEGGREYDSVFARHYDYSVNNDEDLYDYKTVMVKKKGRKDKDYEYDYNDDYNNKRSSSYTLVDIDDGTPIYSLGDTITHSVYGKGTIKEIINGFNKKLIVDFPGIGLRKISLKDVSY